MARFCNTFIVLMLVILKFSHGAVNYCHITTCWGEPHTMCLYNTTKPQCETSGVGLTVKEKDIIVKMHNKFRQRVAAGLETQGSPGPQPAAKNMPDLKWDDELATIAQRSANTCKFGHDKCRDVERFRVGQNIARRRSLNKKYSPDIRKFVQMWYDEVKLFDRKRVQNFRFQPRDGHYTQMLWAKTLYIGCGFIKYSEKEFKKAYLVCNYGPTGNYNHEDMYIIR